MTNSKTRRADAAAHRPGSAPAAPSWSPSRIVRLLVAGTLTGLVLWKANVSAVLRAGADADLEWIGAAVLLVVLDRALMAYRWLMLLCPIDARDRPPFREIMRVFFVSTFLGTFLPASVGGDAVRAYGLARLRVPAGPAVASVLMDRLLGVLSIVFVGIVGLLLARSDDVASNRSIGLSMIVAGAVCVVGGLIVFSDRAAGLASAIAARLPIAPVRAMATELTRATRAYSRYHGELTTVFAGSVGVQALRIVQAYCLGRALGLEQALVVYAALIPLILLVMLLPVSINGIGTSQVAFVWFFGRVGVGAAEAFALSVLFVALGVVGNLPGGLLYALGPRAQAT